MFIYVRMYCEHFVLYLQNCKRPIIVEYASFIEYQYITIIHVLIANLFTLTPLLLIYVIMDMLFHLAIS